MTILHFFNFSPAVPSIDPKLYTPQNSNNTQCLDESSPITSAEGSNRNFDWSSKLDLTVNVLTVIGSKGCTSDWLCNLNKQAYYRRIKDKQQRRNEQTQITEDESYRWTKQTKCNLVSQFFLLQPPLRRSNKNPLPNFYERLQGRPRAIIGGCITIYSWFKLLISFVVEKCLEHEHEYMNIPTPQGPI